jgi:hypothetical protein
VIAEGGKRAVHALLVDRRRRGAAAFVVDRHAPPPAAVGTCLALDMSVSFLSKEAPAIAPPTLSCC